MLPARETVTILGNLIDNAIEALADGPEGSDHTIVVDAQVDGNLVLLTVSDTGPGLTEEAAQRLRARLVDQASSRACRPWPRAGVGAADGASTWR